MPEPDRGRSSPKGNAHSGASCAPRVKHWWPESGGLWAREGAIVMFQNVRVRALAAVAAAALVSAAALGGPAHSGKASSNVFTAASSATPGAGALSARSVPAGFSDTVVWK